MPSSLQLPNAYNAPTTAPAAIPPSAAYPAAPSLLQSMESAWGVRQDAKVAPALAYVHNAAMAFSASAVRFARPAPVAAKLAVWQDQSIPV